MEQEQKRKTTKQEIQKVFHKEQELNKVSKNKMSLNSFKKSKHLSKYHKIYQYLVLKS